MNWVWVETTCFLVHQGCCSLEEGVMVPPDPVPNLLPTFREHTFLKLTCIKSDNKSAKLFSMRQRNSQYTHR